jgi:hypothetical protein
VAQCPVSLFFNSIKVKNQFVVRPIRQLAEAFNQQFSIKLREQLLFRMPLQGSIRAFISRAFTGD